MAFRNIKFSVKFPILFSVVGAVACLAVGGAALSIAEKAMVSNTERSLMTVAEGRAIEITQYFDSVFQDLGALSNMSMTRKALAGFGRTFKDGEDARRAYLTGNPFPAGERHKLDVSEAGTNYDAMHLRYHANYLTFLEEKGYHDIFLIDPKGNVVYSTYKEQDFGTNLMSGAQSQTTLGSAVREALGGSEGHVAFRDFQPYAPSGGSAASFVVRRVENVDGSLLGAIALQMPGERLDLIMNAPVGIGESAEAFLISDANMLQSRSMHSLDYAVMDEIDFLPADLHRDHATGQVSHPNGETMFLSVTGVEVAKQLFLVNVWVPHDEIYAPVNNMFRTIGMILGIGVIGSIIAGLLASRMVVSPLKRLRNAVDDLAAGRDVDMKDAERGDEIGDAFKAMGVVQTTGLEAIRVRAALANCDAKFIIADPSGTVVYTNQALENFFRDHGAVLAEHLPSGPRGKIMGADIAGFFTDPARGRELVNGLGSHGASEAMVLGELRVHLNINKITADDGGHIGTLIEWHDDSAEWQLRNGLETVVNAANEGDFSQRIELRTSDANARRVSDGLNALTSVVNDAVEDISTLMSHMRSGDLTYRVTGSYHGRLKELMDNANETAGHLAVTVNDLKSSVNEVNDVSRSIDRDSESLSSQTEGSAASLEETAAAMEEISARVRETDESASEADRYATSAMENAEEGQGVLNETVTAMQSIEESSRKVKAIIAVMEDISLQTDLLALNAGVEAARAGEAGKGFAVVASEVRNLAVRSADAAKDVAELITRSGEHITVGSQLVDRTGDTFRKIVAEVKEVARIIREISDASREQTVRIEEMNTAITAIDLATQNNAQVAQANFSSARALSQQAERLDQLVRMFHTDLAEEEASAMRHAS